jgi:type II secretory pathway component PulF
MQNGRTLRALHATTVASLVAAAVYLYVPRFEPVFAPLGSDLPFSARILMSSYPFAFVLPVLAVAAVLLPSSSSRWLRFVVPTVYVTGMLLIAFVVWASYAPMFALNEGK